MTAVDPAVAEKRVCSVCGGPLGRDNRSGICRCTPECVRAGDRARRAATWKAKSEAERAAHGAATYAGRLAGYDLHEREQELAGRAGQACPVCGLVLGANGGCWRGQGCIDDTMARVIPAWNPAALDLKRK